MCTQGVNVLSVAQWYMYTQHDFYFLILQRILFATFRRLNLVPWANSYPNDKDFRNNGIEC